MASEKVLAYLDSNRQRHLDQLCDFLRIASISSQDQHAEDIRRAAEFVAAELKSLGLDVAVVAGGGHPLVYAQTPVDPGRPTLLIYGHYDVQPVDPLDLWTSPPFSPTLRDGYVYARGATDDKGQLYAHLKAVEAYRNTGEPLPVNLKFLIEGEEECGGRSVYDYTEAQRERLACDAVVISDTSLYNESTPAVCYSLRGIAYMEIEVQGPDRDLHSGSYGGAVRNPANALAQILARLQDGDGRCLVPGFYDDVIPLDAAERQAFASLGYDERTLAAETGAPAGWGEKGYSILERMWARPSCDVNGLGAGYAGQGAKTIIPAVALAKVSMRLVPDQRPQKIAEAFARYVQDIAPQGVRVQVRTLHAAAPVMVPRDSSMMRAGMRALEAGFGRRPVFIREGGSIPIVGTFQECLRAPVLLLGFGLPTDNAHSPNERFPVENFWRGARTSAILMAEAARGI